VTGGVHDTGPAGPGQAGGVHLAEGRTSRGTVCLVDCPVPTDDCVSIL
jgi:hypothetical protein